MTDEHRGLLQAIAIYTREVADQRAAALETKIARLELAQRETRADVARLIKMFAANARDPVKHNGSNGGRRKAALPVVAVAAAASGKAKPRSRKASVVVTLPNAATKRKARA